MLAKYKNLFRAYKRAFKRYYANPLHWPDLAYVVYDTSFVSIMSYLASKEMQKAFIRSYWDDLKFHAKIVGFHAGYILACQREDMIAAKRKIKCVLRAKKEAG